MKKPQRKQLCTVEEKRRIWEKSINSYFIRPQETDKVISLIGKQVDSLLKELNVELDQILWQVHGFSCAAINQYAGSLNWHFENPCFS